MNSYTITKIDQKVQAVYVTLKYGDKELNHTVFAKDLKNVDAVKEAILQDYATFKKEVDATIIVEPLPSDIESLIGLPQEVE